MITYLEAVHTGRSLFSSVTSNTLQTNSLQNIFTQSFIKISILWYSILWNEIGNVYTTMLLDRSHDNQRQTGDLPEVQRDLQGQPPHLSQEDPRKEVILSKRPHEHNFPHKHVWGQRSFSAHWHPYSLFVLPLPEILVRLSSLGLPMIWKDKKSFK